MTARALLGLAVITTLAGLSPARAADEIITVTISAEVIDVDWQTATVADLPGPDGEVSFSEALIAANHTPGHQTIGFAIPQDDWILQFLYPGRAVLTALTGYYFNATEMVTIDGTTQTAAIGDTNPGGCEIVIYGDDLSVGGVGSTLIGFDSTSVSMGSNALVEGNTGTMNIALGGSGSTARNNTGGTLQIGGSDHVIVGNTFDRIRIVGDSGSRVGGPAPADRNFFTGYGYVNSEGLPAGIVVQIFNSVGTVVENNWIGTTPDGLAQGDLRSTQGVSFQGDNHDVVVRNNRIAGILGLGQGPHHAGQLFGWAILVSGTGSSIDIVGNTIGLDANDQPVLGSVWGIDIGNAITNPCSITDLRIGGPGPGEGNTIAGQYFNGITIGRDVPPVRFSGNAIHDNGWLGIDLIPTSYGYGVDANDPLDADTGGNGLQNFPVIASATREGSMLRVIGNLPSAPSTAYTIEYFASPACDDSGHGQARTFLGTAGVTTDAAGDAPFDVLLPVMVTDGWLVTATAISEPEGATSELSACVLVVGDVMPGDVNGDSFVNVTDLLMVLAAWGPCPECPEDVNASDMVDVTDLLMVLAAWPPV